jgi:rhamnosyltransferase subunit B
MARILLATLGSLGDLHPFLAVGAALRRRGHAVRLASSVEYRSRIEAAGLEAAPLAPSMDTLGDRERVARRYFNPFLGAPRLFREMILAPMRQAEQDLEAALAGIDLVVSHPLTPLLPALAEKRGLPWLTTVLAPFSLFSTRDPPVLPNAEWLHRLKTDGDFPHGHALSFARRVVRRIERPLHERRRELGLPELPGSLILDGQFSPYATLALFDGVLAPPQADWPVNTVLCGTPLHDAGDPEQDGAVADAEALQAFLDDGPAPIVFALGSSAVWIAKDFWHHAVAACQALGLRGVLLTGRPLAGVVLPPTVRAASYAPYSAVFPRAAAVVHQGGIGTLSQALRAGRPQLVVPAGFDQADNAARAVRLGLAASLPFGKVSTARMTRLLRALVADGGKAAVAADVAARLRDGGDGAARAAAAIEGLLAGRETGEPSTPGSVAT